MLNRKIMKAHYFKTGLITALLIIGISLQAQSLKKDFHKEYSASSSTELTLSNQFGTITVTDWDKNQVVIDVVVEVKTENQSKAQSLLDDIDVEFNESGNQISAKTILGHKGKFNTGKGDKKSFSIDYTVKCPKGINLTVNHQFGNLGLSSLTGPVKIDLQFGSLNAVNLTGPKTDIDMQFGSLTIGKLGDAKISIQHVDAVKIEEAGNLSLKSQFSEVNLGSVTSLSGDLNSGKLQVEKLTGRLDVKSNMGSIDIDQITKGFGSIDIVQNMGDVTLGIDQDAGYKLEAKVNMGSIKVPDNVKVEKDRDSGLPGVSAKNVRGTAGDGSSMVKIDVNMGSARIK
jgi:hypothetical protein